MKLNKSTFKKHQKLLLWLANNRFLNWLVGTNRLPSNLSIDKIVEITPNSITRIDGGYRKTAIFTRPRFAEALAFNISPIPVINLNGKAKYRFSPVGLAFGALIGYFGGFGLVADTVYTSAGDGYVRKNDSTNWDTTHDATEGTLAIYTYTDDIVPRTGEESNGAYRIARAFIPFDTSGLSGTVDSGSLNLKNKNSNVEDADAQAYIRIVEANNSLSILTRAVGDYNDCGDTDNPAACANDVDIADIIAESYEVFTLNSTGIAHINIGGNTIFGAREGHDVEDVAYAGGTGVNLARFYTSQQTGTSDDPYLDLTLLLDENNAIFFGTNF